ncbi:MAG: Endo-1,4-beta-xylanase Z precursor [Firmicutes bacterium ADurb.Bin419]|nr:MAG: Endo-1,4-beta-xylanase Z precursor [Firmicutes bacterium ADurb.Bin419]
MTLTQAFGVLEKSSPRKLGDINESGEINSIDCALLMKHLLGMAGSKLTGEKLIIADVDGNGTVNVIDLAYMKQYILGMIKNFPRE